MNAPKNHIAVDVRFVGVDPNFTPSGHRFVTPGEIDELHNSATDEMKEQGVAFVKIEDNSLSVVVRGFEDHTKFLGRSVLLMLSFIIGTKRFAFTAIPVELSRFVDGDKVVGRINNFDAVASDCGYAELFTAIKAIGEGHYSAFKNTMLGRMFSQVIEEGITDKKAYQNCFERMHAQFQKTAPTACYISGYDLFDEKCTVIAHPTGPIGFDILVSALASGEVVLVPDNVGLAELYKELDSKILLYYKINPFSEDAAEHQENKRKFLNVFAATLNKEFSDKRSLSILLTNRWQIQALREKYCKMYEQGYFTQEQAPSLILAISNTCK